MRREEKARTMNEASYDINIAKDRLFKAVEILSASEMHGDAEKILDMIAKLERLQIRYEEF